MALSLDTELNWNFLLDSIKNAMKDKQFKKDEISALLSSYKSQDEDWMRYVFFDEKFYTRNLVDEGDGNYNMMVLAWNPSQGSCIHNHNNSSCFIKILSGALREIRYDTPEEGKPLKVIEHVLRKRDDVTYMDDAMGVHEIKNDTANQSVSLHLYIPPYEMFQSYDRETAKAVKLSVKKFTSSFGVINAEDTK